MRTFIAAVILAIASIGAAAQAPAPAAGKPSATAAPAPGRAKKGPAEAAPGPATTAKTPGASAPTSAPSTPTPAPPHAYLYIGWPNDGQVVSADKPIRVWFGLRNMGVAPKGVAFPNTGHHHLLIDADPPAAGEEIPNDRNHLHFGAGESETTVQLAPGKHTLQLVMGDAHHRSFDPPVVSKKITITVK